MTSLYYEQLLLFFIFSYFEEKNTFGKVQFINAAKPKKCMVQLYFIGHTDGSPFPPSSQSMTSPAASNWPGSPSMPRPSPARPGQSPGGHAVMHSPQSEHKSGVHLSRVLPQKSWAGAVPTLLTYEALETLCCPSPHPQGLHGPELAPLERFLGCVYMRRQLQRFIHSEHYVRFFYIFAYGLGIIFMFLSADCSSYK